MVVQAFTASGVYMPSPGLVWLTVECIGGGGGGGAAPSDTGSARAGAGGGSGGYSRKTLPASLVLGGVTITIGAGGVAGSSAAPVYIGGNGGATTFGALCTAHGGLGGQSYGIGGAGGSPGIGDMAMPGTAGASGQSQIVVNAIDFIAGGRGGSMWGGAMPMAPVSSGADGYGVNGMPNTGAGGTGGASNAAATPIQGGVGGSGFCIVTETCVAPVPAPAPPASCAGMVNVNAWPGQQWGFDG
jgi:hypothetical protein